MRKWLLKILLFLSIVITAAYVTSTSISLAATYTPKEIYQMSIPYSAKIELLKCYGANQVVTDRDYFIAVHVYGKFDTTEKVWKTETGNSSTSYSDVALSEAVSDLPSLSNTEGNGGLISNSDKQSAGIYVDEYNRGYSTTISADDSSNSKKPGFFAEALIELLCDLADGINSLLTSNGANLDNILFGRVGGNGVRFVKNGVYDTTISLFSFELDKGNPYGVIAAIIFQKVRGIMYVCAAIVCLIRIIAIGIKLNHEQIRKDSAVFFQNVLMSAALMVFMPYFFDLYLFFRDMLLKFLVGDIISDIFGNASLSIIDIYKSSASASIINALLYLGAVGISLVFAAIYIAYAMSMVIHFCLFPVVCTKAIIDRKEYGKWIAQAVGLTIMPVIDGVLFLFPIAFKNLGVTLLAIISAGMLLTARSQARESLGIHSNGIDGKALASVMGMAHLAKGIGRGLKNAGGRLVGGLKAAKEDNDMAGFYEDMGVTEFANRDGGENPAVTNPNAHQAKEGSAENVAAMMHANTGNFENAAFRGKLTNQQLSQLYRKRAGKNLRHAITGSLGAAAGGIAGGAAGFGAGMFMGTGMQGFLTGTGIDAGSTLGGYAGEAGGDVGVALFNGGAWAVQRAGKAFNDIGDGRNADIAMAGAAANWETDAIDVYEGEAISNNLPVTTSRYGNELSSHMSRGASFSRMGRGRAIEDSSSNNNTGWSYNNESSASYEQMKEQERSQATAYFNSREDVQIVMETEYSVSARNTAEKIVSNNGDWYKKDEHDKYLEAKQMANNDHGEFSSADNEKYKEEGRERLRKRLGEQCSVKINDALRNNSTIARDLDKTYVNTLVDAFSGVAGEKFKNSNFCTANNFDTLGFTFEWND